MSPRQAKGAANKQTESRKRKEPPGQSNGGAKIPTAKREFKRNKTLDARVIVTQNSDAALKNGELNVESFLAAREFEIQALQNSIQKSKRSLNTKALQRVPRSMRRRTASHNVKRVPKRLQKRAEKEMQDGNTPTVRAGKRKPRNSRAHLRAETAKRLRLLAATKRSFTNSEEKTPGIKTREPRPKLQKDKLNQPPEPKSKFRKRQIHKTWLPTHVWHAKRAKMTDPKKPLWRFAIPISPTEKSYRPTHRAGSARGAIAWDMSYTSTICLEGGESELENVLKAVGITEPWLWNENNTKWKNGTKAWNGWLIRLIEEKRILIGLCTALWFSPAPCIGPETSQKDSKRLWNRVLIRLHPSAFLEAWTELLRLSKLQRPVVQIHDLRFEVGSIEITGPGSTEALLGILHPHSSCQASDKIHAETFTSLAGVTNPSALPPGAVLAFSILDPRLRYPARPVDLPSATDEAANFNLLKILSAWPPGTCTSSSALLDPDVRFKATRLPSQKALNRRKGLAPPGSYPALTENDPPIPVILLASRPNPSVSTQGTWTLLAPWKCILPIWYGLVHYPLSTGQNIRFGGLQELRQIHFERRIPWFPGDYPGTKAGFSWETQERLERHQDWAKRPKGKRVEWSSLDLGNKRKGEVGLGWSNDFEYVLQASLLGDDNSVDKDVNSNPSASLPVEHITGKNFTTILSNRKLVTPPANKIATVHITLLGRGVATACARIYRLPRQTTKNTDISLSGTLPATLREQWLSLLPSKSKSKLTASSKVRLANRSERIPLNVPLSKRVQLLAKSLLQEPPLPYPCQGENKGVTPLVPDVEDLIGFVTTGEFCLADGGGTAMGSLLVSRALEGAGFSGSKPDQGARLCIVRNAGENVARLARWEVANG
ncbi:BgTH12-05298 [Blumeria graminis f. sp. triticale]|uniref:BgTH12-05298 n=1 Tax=Blumeria graminis f. sp. triticale TaxID=1689686 RepID=A0A9W4D200_BLUGR|nr:BgTH12-05298 [Blumeria graminis f. sp. triticale]